MERLTQFKLTPVESRKPIFQLSNDSACLLDTGAYLSLIIDSVADNFGRHEVISEAPLGGFGGDGDMTPIHFWDVLLLKQGASEIVFHNTVSYVPKSSFHDVILAPFFLKGSDIILSRDNVFVLRGNNVIDCRINKYTFPKHFDKSLDLMAMLAQF